jgi:hypothetical protein
MAHGIAALYRAIKARTPALEGNVQAVRDRPAAASAARGRFNSTDACEIGKARRLVGCVPTSGRRRAAMEMARSYQKGSGRL